jgi:hypothetical protein
MRASAFGATYALDRAHGPGPEARPRTVRDREVHGHADDGDIEIVQGLLIGEVQERRQPREGRRAPASLQEEALGDALEVRIVYVVGLLVGVLRAQGSQLVRVHHESPSLRTAVTASAGSSIHGANASRPAPTAAGALLSCGARIA